MDYVFLSLQALLCQLVKMYLIVTDTQLALKLLKRTTMMGIPWGHGIFFLLIFTSPAAVYGVERLLNKHVF